MPSQQHISIEQTSSEKLEEFQFVSKDRLKWFYSQLALFKTFNFQTLFAVMNNYIFLIEIISKWLSIGNENEKIKYLFQVLTIIVKIVRVYCK